MKTFIFIAICLVPVTSGLWCADDPADPTDLLTRVMSRLVNIDQSYIIDMDQTQTGKPDVHREFLTRIGWSGGKIRQSIRIDYLHPLEMKGVVFWEHRYEDQPRRRWRTLPVTGKLKELKKTSDKSIKKNGFDFSELELSPQMIRSHTHSIIGSDTLLNRPMLIVEFQDTTSRIKDQETKRLWIDPERNLIMKVVITDDIGREIKTAECTGVKEIDGKYVYGTIEIHEKKKKQNILMRIRDYSFKKIDDPDIFTPKDQ